MCFGQYPRAKREVVCAMNKGDIVKAKACVWTKYLKYPIREAEIFGELKHIPKGGGLVKCLIRFQYGGPIVGVVEGYSYRATGWYGYEDMDCPAHLMEDKRHKVVRVQPLDGTSRYYEPLVCLEEDLEVVLDIQEALSTKDWLDMLEEQRCP